MQFRGMRRVRQQMQDSEAQAVLAQGTEGVLAVAGDDGYPYAVPVNYVYQDGKIYLHGAKTGHKIEALQRNPKCSFCVIADKTVLPEKLATNYRSVIAFCRARIITDTEETVAIARAIGQGFSDDMENINSEIKQTMPSLCCIEPTVEHLTGKVGLYLLPERKSQQ